MTIGHRTTLPCPSAEDLASDLKVGTGAPRVDANGDTWCIHDDPRLVPDWAYDEESGYIPPSADWCAGTEGLSSPPAE